MMDENLLTPAEHGIIDKLGQCAGAYKKLLSTDPNQHHRPPDYPYDIAEFVDKIHQLQHTIVARAAVRAYPERYRL